MPSSPPLPGEGLVAILLMTRSRPGPRLVFHYPEEPTSTTNPPDTLDDGGMSDESSDDEVRISRTPVHARTTRFAGISELVPSLGKLDLHSRKPVTGGEILTGKVLGHSVGDLEKVLSPGRWSDQKRFEICMDGFTFIGHPVYAPDDGDWSPKPEIRDSTKPKRNGLNTHQPGFLDVESFQPSAEPSPSISQLGLGREERTDYDFTHMPDSFEENKGNIHRHLGTSMESSSTNSNTATASSEKMTMFQIVLVLSPDKAKDAEALYTEIVKPLSKALHYCQKQSNYLSSETRKLLALKTKAKQKPRFTREDEQSLWRNMLETSELAWSLAELHSKISMGDIASFRLNGLEMTLCTSSPTITQQHPLSPSSALLLTQTPESLLADLSHQPTSTPLTHFLQSHTPTKSLQKLSQTLQIPLPSLITLSSHLIFYRKAIPLAAPLHWRNIYVVAPSAPVHELGRWTEQYAKLFPTLPSLPNMLKVLSGRPIRYGVLVPSRDHRGKYLEILAWLVREGFVVQARRFGWIRVPKYMLQKRAEKNGRGGSGSEFAIAEDDGGSVSSGRTAIAHGGRLAGVGVGVNRRLSEILSERRGVMGRKQRGSDATTSVQGSVFSSSEREEEDGSAAGEGTGNGGVVLVKDPSAELHLLEHLQSAFEDQEDREILASILPLFDGEHAFEDFAGEVGLKRSSVERVIEGLEGRGWVRCLKSI